jgi:hypothetical protein
MDNPPEKPVQTPTQKFLGWAFIAAILVGLFMLFQEPRNSNLRLISVGLIALLLVISTSYTRWRSSRDPAYAAQTTRIKGQVRQNGWRRFRGRLIWTSAALVLVAVLNLLQKHSAFGP